MSSNKTRKTPLVSIIIIDYKIKNPYLDECLEAIKNQSYKNYEIILITDYKTNISSPKLTKHYFSRYTNPATKRDYGAKIAKGEIFAFIDDDAYPDTNWLSHIIDNFNDSKIAAVGGPGVTPPNVTWQESASGWTSSSPLGAGPYTYRFLPGKRKYVEDYPSMNLSVRKTDFFTVGGFDSHYWPGEDTKLCLDLVYKLNKKIIYDPKAIVYHHRRPLLVSHLKQNGNYGLHRGFFAKILPQTSLKPIYFFPSLLSILIFSLLITLIFSIRKEIFTAQIIILSIYLLALIINGIWIGIKSKSPPQAIIAIPSVFITHFWYGLKFIQGFVFTKRLKR